MAMRSRPLWTPGLLALALAGCDNADRAHETAPDQPTELVLPGASDADGDGVIEVPGSPSPLDTASSGAAASEPEDDPVINEPFRGRWVTDLGQCRSQPAPGRIVIGASKIQFAEAAGDPLAVMQEGERTISVTLRIVQNGVRGERTDRLTIDPDGSQLNYAMGSMRISYVRCPV